MRHPISEYNTPQATGVDIRPPATAVLGVSSMDRHPQPAPTTYPAWNAATVYKIGDRVSFGGLPYQALVGNTNVTPTGNPLTWELIQPTSPLPPWNIATTYDTGDMVSYNDESYISLVAANVGNDPLLTLGTSWDLIDSPFEFRVRTGPGTPFAFQINTQQPLLSGYFTRLAVTEMSLVYALPTITYRNNKIGIKYNTAAGQPTFTRYLTIPSGWYSVTQLANELQTQVRSATGITAFTVTVNVPSSLNENAGVFQCASNGLQQFAFIPVNPLDPAAGMTGAAYSVIRTQYLQGRQQLFDQLGFAPNTGTLATQYNLATQYTTGVVSLLSTKFIDVLCSKLTANQNTRDGDTSQRPRDILCRLYLEAQAESLNPENLGSQPFRVYREWSFPKQIAWSPDVTIGGLEFQLVDDQGFALSTYETAAVVGYLNDNQQPDWNMTLLASEQ